MRKSGKVSSYPSLLLTKSRFLCTAGACFQTDLVRLRDLLLCRLVILLLELEEGAEVILLIGRTFRHFLKIFIFFVGETTCFLVFESGASA